jgi:UPF0755 protein
VFENRLKKNMRLQSDPTIIYGLAGGKGGLDHPIQQDELERDTAYNTYKINGLPPTPIANPGRAAIEAVLKPAKTKDLYFVADGTGGHAFAPNLEEHNKNVARWRQVERELAAKAAAAKAAQGGGAQDLGAKDLNLDPGALPAAGALLNGDGPAAAATAAEPAPAGAANAEPVPLPKRNPKR